MNQDISMRMLVKQIGHLYMKRLIALQDKEDLKIGGGGTIGILFMLEKRDGLSQRQIARYIGMKPPSVTVALRKLEAEKYLIREQDQKDQRITRIYLTDEGRRVAAKSREVMEQAEEEMLMGISPEEKMLMKRLMMQMRENLNHEDELGNIGVFPKCKQ